MFMVEVMIKFLTPSDNRDTRASNFGNKEWIIVNQDGNKLEAFVNHTSQQLCQLLIIGNSGK